MNSQIIAEWGSTLHFKTRRHLFLCIYLEGEENQRPLPSPALPASLPGSSLPVFLSPFTLFLFLFLESFIYLLSASIVSGPALGTGDMQVTRETPSSNVSCLTWGSGVARASLVLMSTCSKVRAQMEEHTLPPAPCNIFLCRSQSFTGLQTFWNISGNSVCYL